MTANISFFRVDVQADFNYSLKFETKERKNKANTYKSRARLTG